MKVVKDDMILVISGDDKGKRGKVLKVFPKHNRLIVESINFIKRHERPTQKNPKGGIVEKEAPIQASNVMVICGKCNNPTRLSHRRLQDGKKARICKHCGEML